MVRPVLKWRNLKLKPPSKLCLQVCQLFNQPTHNYLTTYPHSFGTLACFSGAKGCRQFLTGIFDAEMRGQWRLVNAVRRVLARIMISWGKEETTGHFHSG